MYEFQRKQMIQKFLVEAGIENKIVISAMSKVPRHLFVDQAISHQAYKGDSLPIGYGQTISHPTTVALMSQIMDLQEGYKILEIGTGSGYQAAVLSEMGVKVYSIERIPELADRSRKLLQSLGYYDIAVKIGDGSMGWKEHAPYDRIIVTAAARDIPGHLAEQLTPEGRMVIPLGSEADQKLVLIQKRDGQLIIEEQPWRKFVPLVSRKGWLV
jgi:protein-L-isoaspartate(D-aspartate) O-methyltransferase